MYEQTLSNPQWYMAELDDLYFTKIFGKTLVVFMGDHAAKDGSWFISHGSSSNEKVYPYPLDAYKLLRKKIAAYEGPVIIASHYALTGQRPSNLLHMLLPLPSNVMLHLHGHAHIGDMIWNKENPWQRNNPIKDSTIRQINISAMETERSPGSHSAILSLGINGPERIRIRCSQRKQWIEEFILPTLSEIL